MLFSHVAEPQLLSHILYEQCDEQVPSIPFLLMGPLFLKSSKEHGVGYSGH